MPKCHCVGFELNRPFSFFCPPFGLFSIVLLLSIIQQRFLSDPDPASAQLGLLQAEKEIMDESMRRRQLSPLSSNQEGENTGDGEDDDEEDENEGNDDATTGMVTTDNILHYNCLSVYPGYF